MDKHKVLQTLQNGISEIIFTDEHSIEHAMIGTLSPTHLPDDIQTNTNTTNKSNMITVFNVPKEEWQKISVQNIIDIEQLTGHGAENNKSKLTASDEYLAELLRTTEEEKLLHTTEEDEE